MAINRAGAAAVPRPLQTAVGEIISDALNVAAHAGHSQLLGNRDPALANRRADQVQTRFQISMQATVDLALSPSLPNLPPENSLSSSVFSRKRRRYAERRHQLAGPQTPGSGRRPTARPAGSRPAFLSGLVSFFASPWRGPWSGSLASN